MALSAQFEAKLKEIVDGEREVAVLALTQGGPEDYAAYREQVGYIRGLDQLDRWCVEALNQLDER